MIEKETHTRRKPRVFWVYIGYLLLFFQLTCLSAQPSAAISNYILYDQDGVRVNMELVKPAIPCGENSHGWIYKITTYNLEKITPDRKYLTWRIIMKNCNGQRIQRFFQLDLLGEGLADEIQMFKLDWKFEAESIESLVINVHLNKSESSEKDVNLDEGEKRQAEVVGMYIHVDTSAKMTTTEKENLEKNVVVVEESHLILNEMNMVFIKGGTFQMGCTNDQASACEDDEKPAHSITVSDFYMSKYEVTQKQWREVMGSTPSYFMGCNECPVENVSWNDIQEFLMRLNGKTGNRYRLPTEAEWEFAARGGLLSQGYKYAGSDNLEEVGWHDNNAGNKTHPVGQKKPNELGLYDMSGNVWEWCQDWYGGYSSAPATNPKGPAAGSYRVVHGGSWYSFAQYCRVALRNYDSPGNRFNDLGFRLARTR